jgi:glycogen debranching enzyme
MIVEYYDIRTGKTHDYNLNINDNTPLIILALWHHFNTTGDEAFLHEVYPRPQSCPVHPLSATTRAWCGVPRPGSATGDLQLA